ncbi:MAG: hypothetical protein J6K22_01905 [Spirochaetaceae bacterium]|nr:hypothetical protein [Spirochaetaceae bacterium]
MQKKINLKKQKSDFTRFAIFTVLFLIVSFSSFAEKNHIISPISGTWSNYQTILLDVPEGASAFYSFTGDNPLYSGFAYEKPVLLELEGNINLKVAIVNTDNSVIEESVDFSVKNSPIDLQFYIENKNQALIPVKEKNVSIPSYMKYSISDSTEPYLKGRTLTINSENSLEQILPLVIKNQNDMYRFMLHIMPSVSKYDSQYNFTNNTLSNDVTFEDDYTVRRIEKKLSQVPFTLEFTDWTKLKISANENIYISIDDDIWQTGTFVLDINRNEEHTLSWIDLSGLNPEEFIPEQFKVCYTVIPKMPNLVVVQEKTKVVNISLDDKFYTMKILQDYNFSSSVNDYKKNYCLIDTILGNYLEKNICFDVFYDNVYQGKLSTEVLIDKESPKIPDIEISNKNFFVREPVSIKFKTDEKVFYVLKSKLLSNLNLKNLELEVNKNFDIDLNSAVELTNDTLYLAEDKNNAIFYNLAYFSKDDFGNVSDIEYYQILIDSYNYYIESSSKNTNYIQDGSAARPFSDISQILPYLNKNEFIKIHIEGTFENIPSMVITSPCEFISVNGARLSFAEDSFFDVQSSSLKIYNCIFEQDFTKNKNSFSQQNLFKLNNSSLIIDSCEFVSLYENNGSVIFADNSDVTILNSGITIQSNIFASVFNLLNSYLTCKQSRISAVSDSSIALTMNLGKLVFENSQFYIDGKTTKFYELFGVEYNINNNKFLYKNYSNDMESSDIFSTKKSYSNNEVLSF